MEVLRAATPADVVDWEPCAWYVKVLGEPLSMLSGPSGTKHAPFSYCALRDSNLRPIRDQDGEDETLTWAGKPEQVTA